MSVSLLEKTGVQFVRGSIQLAKEDLAQHKLVFQEYDSKKTFLPQVRPLIRVPGVTTEAGRNCFVISELVKFGVLLDGFEDKLGSNEVEKLKAVMELGGGITALHENDVEKLTLSENKLKKYEGLWLPLPIAHRDAESGSSELSNNIDSRIWFELREGKLEYVVAIDTSGFESLTSPQSFVVGSAPEMVDEMLTGVWSNYLNGQWFRPSDSAEHVEEKASEIGGLWDATFRLFLSWFKASASIDIQLAEKVTSSAQVCAYIDFGNESTSVLLREENRSGAQNPDFQKVQELELFDFGDPLTKSSGPFSTNAAFREGKFLKPEASGFDGDSMVWLSPMALGNEAGRLLSSEGLARAAESRPMGCHSPKRFLWDDAPADRSWVFASSATGGRQDVFVQGVTDQMTITGKYIPQGAEAGEEVNPTRQLFSRQSISTFVFLEICTQIHRQINSPDFRESHGSRGKLRALNRVVISCPTGMSKLEQTALRKACENALQICQDNLDVYKSSLYTRSAMSRPKVVPSSKELGLPNDQLADRTQWNVDEATLGQVLWMYTELVHRRGVNSSQFLRDFGKTDSIRVASVDVGAGTTDIMVCDHRVHPSNELVEVRPQPVFWDSILKAGDDLLEEIIRKVILVGSEERKGLLIAEMEEKSVANPRTKITNVFGKNHANQSVSDQARRQFALQNLITPLAKRFLDEANRDGEIAFTSQEILGEGVSWNKELTKHFKTHLGVDLLDMSWCCSTDRVNQIAIEFFRKQWKVISEVFEVAKPDVLLLAGGVFKSDALSRLMAQYSGTPLSRIVNMNTYVLGRWFPFVDGDGKLTHAKSLVSVGVAIADLAEHNQLKGFKLNTDRLITEVKNDELYFYIKRAEGGVRQIMASQDNTGSVSVSQVPARLLTSGIPSPNYPKKDCYRLDFNWSKIQEDVCRAHPELDAIEDAAEIEARAREYVVRFAEQAPFDIDVVRHEDDREQLKVDEVELQDEEKVTGRTVGNRHFELHFESLPGGDLWMEKGLKL